MSTDCWNTAFMRSSTVKTLLPKSSGISILVPKGRAFVATMPSWTYVPFAVMKGVLSVSSGTLVYAVILMWRILNGKMRNGVTLGAVREAVMRGSGLNIGFGM